MQLKNSSQITYSGIIFHHLDTVTSENAVQANSIGLVISTLHTIATFTYLGNNARIDYRRGIYNSHGLFFIIQKNGNNKCMNQDTYTHQMILDKGIVNTIISFIHATENFHNFIQWSKFQNNENVQYINQSYTVMIKNKNKVMAYKKGKFQVCKIETTTIIFDEFEHTEIFPDFAHSTSFESWNDAFAYMAI
jgi:hypothetical protein